MSSFGQGVGTRYCLNIRLYVTRGDLFLEARSDDLSSNQMMIGGV